VRVGLVIGLILAGLEVPGVVWGNAIGMGMTGLLYWSIASRVMRRAWGASPFQGRWQALQGLRKEIFSFLAYSDVTALLNMIPNQLDVVLLGYIRDPTEAGYYKLAKSLASVVNFLSNPLESVTYPELARLWGLGDRKELYQRIRRLAFQVGVPLGCLFGIVSILMSPFVITTMIGGSFVPAILPAQLLLVGFSFWLAGFWFRPFYLSIEQMHFWFVLSAVSAMVSIPFFSAGAALWGFKGVAAARCLISILRNTTAAIRAALIMKEWEPNDPHPGI
jgi:O-antigen/teichoic acid export membrane protein